MIIKLYIIYYTKYTISNYRNKTIDNDNGNDSKK